MSASAKPFSPFTLDNGWIVEFPTDPAGVLRLEPGKVCLNARLSGHKQTEDKTFLVVLCELRLADAEGRLWQTETAFFSRHLLYPLIDLSRKESAYWLRNAPEDWLESLKQQPLLTGLSAVFDDRFYRLVWIDNTGFCLHFKYLYAGFQIAPLPPDRLVVQVGDLFCSWNPLPTAAPDGTPVSLPNPLRISTDEERDEEDRRYRKEGWSGDYDTVHPLAYPIDAGRVFFRKTAVQDSEGEWHELSIDQPVIFRRVRGKSKLQPFVTFRPRAKLTPPLQMQARDTGYVPMVLENGMPLAFLTDAGGRLVVESPSLSCKVKLDCHPNSITQHEDVLRCRTRLTDDKGNVWECITHFTPAVFFEKLVNLDDISLRQFESEKEPLMAEKEAVLCVRARLDDGAWRYLLLCDDLIAYRAYGQRPLVEISANDKEFVVRITGLVGRRRPVECDFESRYFVLDPIARAADTSAWETDGLLPPIGFTIQGSDLAFRNTTFAVDDGFCRDNTIPIPVVFTQIGKGEPCPGVWFNSDTT